MRTEFKTFDKYRLGFSIFLIAGAGMLGSVACALEDLFDAPAPPAPRAAAGVRPAPVPAAAPAQVAPRAQLIVTPMARRGEPLVILPAMFPNPLAYNLNLNVITTTGLRRVQALARAEQLRAQALARRQRAMPGPGVEKQMRKMFEPMLKAELSFASRAAGLDDKERKKLVEDTKKWFDSFVVDFMKNMDPNQQQMFLQGVRGVWFGGPRGPQPANPRDALRAGISKLAENSFPKEKLAAYKEECRKRDEFSRQTAVDNLVVRIDEKVKLSPDQWRRISKSLNDHWDTNRQPQLEAFVMSNSMWPGAPNEWVLPELSVAQQAVLRRLNSYSGHVWFGGGIMGGMFGADAAVIEDIEIDVTTKEEKE
jgi:hypothetical protein